MYIISDTYNNTTNGALWSHFIEQNAAKLRVGDAAAQGTQFTNEEAKV